ncbi:molybdopterin-dependent oxidoreductase [Dissulfurirhabdus thermomarina]|uniref:Molybdopterin-dependent oxidoreductase n=2 Tax=Dissulfurirhabdus thermomarina TaxID=1765737 RepID=A0A6N9TNT4_DISTH|nr:molybdopterin-dependent oxidoreductase [Dissulfurirhabdus thermomarina]NMX23793.1 molybdopterin-dependent oxidoreductase [Dissulfurirhabdus thermomarina]
MEVDGRRIRLSRRGFLKSTAFLGGLAAASGLPGFDAWGGKRGGRRHLAANAYPFDRPEGVIYTCCLQCHTACTIKAKVLDGVMVKVDGNPYSPMNMNPHLPYTMKPQDAVVFDGRLCSKGQAGVQTLYDPYRIRKVLKRKPGSRRGENKWVTIDFDKAVDEIVNGGDLFGEGKVPGLKDLFAVRDPAVMKELKADAAAVARGDMTAADFRKKHRARLDLLIDPEHPDLGPVNNQFVFLAGRIEHGRKEFSQRWLKNAFGSVNWYEHTTVCEQSHHIAYNEMTSRYKGGKWHPVLKEYREDYGGGKHHMKPDVPNCEFVIFFGTSPFEANFGPTNWTSYITNAQAKRNFRFAVVDSRLSKTAAKANYWVPVRPGGDAPLALGMLRWIIENGRYNEAYLRAANRAAAAANGDTTWTNATHLVRLSGDGKRGVKLLRGDECKLCGEHSFMVSVGGRLRPFDPYAEKGEPLVGDLFAEGEVNGVRYKTAFALLRDLVMERSLEQWAEAAGVPVKQVVALAREFTSHGRRAVADLYRGPVQHTNGYYNGQAILTLNLMVGNGDWKGGLMVGGGHWHEDGSKKGQPFPVKKGLHPGKVGSFGVTLSREKWHYEDTTLFRRHGYPARRTWYPYTGNVYQEVIPSAADGYPYPIKALFLHKGTPAFSVPGANATIETLRDPKKIPLVFADDIVIGETSMYADYIFPDTAIWERWGLPHLTPAVPTRGSKVRQPAVAPLVETCTVFGVEQPISMEALMLAIAERLGLPGYGRDGFGPGLDFRTREDFYLKMVANIAYGDKGGKDKVPPAGTGEMEIFRKARRHLAGTVFDEKRWKAAVGGGEDLWRRVVYVLNRGGRFEGAEKAYEGARMHHRFASQFNLFVEHVALGRHSMTGENFSGLPIFEPVRDAAGRVVTTGDDYPFQLFTYKLILGGQSRTISNYWTMVSEQERNYVQMNRSDGRRLGLRDGDLVRLEGPSNSRGRIPLLDSEFKEVVGVVRLEEGIRPGTVVASWSYGHWAYGSRDVTVDGALVKGDPRRGAGLCPNAVMMVDPAVRNMCLSDPIGGSCSFYDSWVRVVKV